MTDEWVPENLPILLMNRPLLMTTRTKPIRIGTARVTNADEHTLLAFDAAFQERINNEETFTAKSRYEAKADWIEELTGLPYQVSYYFPSSVRGNRTARGTYGGSGLTYRVLYEALCNAFNGGRRFIEDYFLSVFEDHMKDRYDEAVRGLKQRIADEAQSRRRVHKAYLRNFVEWSSPMTVTTFETLARETKKDVVASLSTGKIPLQKQSLSPRTLEIRKRLGIASDQIFYATGKLISSIVISVILLDKDTAAQEGER